MSLIHRSLIPKLHPILRIYVGCAEMLFGDIHSVDMIKIHKQSGKVSLMKYDGFKGKALPELHERIKVNLRQQEVDVFDHHSTVKQQILFCKERFVSMNYQGREKWEAFSRWLESKGVDVEAGYGVKQDLLMFLEINGFTDEYSKWEEWLQHTGGNQKNPDSAIR